ncbi:MAG: hypothetical protein EPO13_07900 [Actinomycetota bacterium]|nr:MAG: hypothetical protein EPO13_07900 [Actinomycetota bacterium]
MREPDWTILDDALAYPQQCLGDLSAYHHLPVSLEGVGFIGRLFDPPMFAASTATPAVTPGDILAVSMLSQVIPPRAAACLVQSPPPELVDALQAIPPEAELGKVDDPASEWLRMAAAAQAAVAGMAGMTRSTTSAVLARKWPGLVPIEDDVTMAAFGEPDTLWEPLRQRLRGGLHDQVEDLLIQTMLVGRVSVLRAIGTILWMRQRDPADGAVPPGFL